jgi:hypothetical protein
MRDNYKRLQVRECSKEVASWSDWKQKAMKDATEYLWISCGADTHGGSKEEAIEKLNRRE